jgi:hypothetical protein
MKHSNNEADQQNPNTGTSGTNAAYQAMLDNRSIQMNTNQPRSKK